ncbi:MAG: prolyl oligopeptidase family serine peptidase, partial [Myxococcota bacterium]
RLHTLGTNADSDEVLYEEKDSGFFAGLSRSQSGEFIFIGSGDHVTSEVYAVPASNPRAKPLVFAPRKKGHQYDVDHANGTFYIRTNDTHENFRIVTAAEDSPAQAHWKELIGGSDSTYIRGISSFKNFLAIQERVDGLDQIRIRNYDGSEHRVAFPEAAYAAGMGSNPEFDISTLRLNYESMVTPDTVYDYDVSGKTLNVLKVQEIPSGYSATQYVTERRMAKARDGVSVPVSIVYRKDLKKGAGNPLHLYGYGAYGYGMPPGFSTNRLSLLDRGFVYAIAHIRGGDEMGYSWYTSGKLDKRTNTFNDFVDVARFLVEEGYVQSGDITISGGSAGGELMGAVVNQAPELFRGVVAHVPFVDVLNTMLDTSLPLTPMEWPEWGNPIEDKAAFEFIRSYSPYDNVEAKAYPPIMITGGLNDPRVTYWEPAKWAAKLRATKTDDNLLLLKINMGAGHAGKTGRFVRLQEAAEEYTFLLMATGRAAP